LLLRINQNQKLIYIVLHQKDIKRINIKSSENFTPHFLSPMWILLKLGVTKRYARYFKTRSDVYKIDPVKLTINTVNGSLEFQSNGYHYENLVNYFRELKTLD
jgi:hypothetical protein